MCLQVVRENRKQFFNLIRMPAAKRLSSPCDDDDEEEIACKRQKNSSRDETTEEEIAGTIEKVYMKNFMCHACLEVNLNKSVNFIVGRNGSGKSAILAAVVIALGCKASSTNRASSLKAFIKNGAHSAIVQVTLKNKGLYAYKQEVYGTKIIVARQIYSTSTPSAYKFKSATGLVISTKREELEKIIAAFNIQADNPISVLNQDTARTFLSSTEPAAKYALFMKATKLEDVDQLHAQTLQCEAHVLHRLKLRKESTVKQEQEIKELERKVHALKKLEEVKKKAVNFENEYYWALARDAEKSLEGLKCKIDKEKENIQPLLITYEKNKEEYEATVNSLSETKDDFEAINNKVKEGNDKLDAAKSDYKEAKSNYVNCLHKYKQLDKEQSKYKEDMKAVRQEIEKHKGGQENVLERKRLSEAIQHCKSKQGQILAVQHTSEMEFQNLRGERNLFQEQAAALRIEKQAVEQAIRTKRNQLQSHKSQSDDLTIYGDFMPRLVQKIEEYYRQNRFERKPLGPIGRFLKVKEDRWARAIEMEIKGVLQSFACHCSKDARILQSLFKEIGSRIPGIFVSRFTDKLHNIHNVSVKAPGYHNIFDTLHITDVNVANTLIDQCNIEAILLIPTGQEAANLMSTNAPKNCKKSVTMNGDQYFPYPDYRMYAGNKRARVTLLQVTKQDIIRQLESEVENEQQNLIEVETKIREINEKLDENKFRITELQMKITELRSSKSVLSGKISEYENAIDMLPDPQHFLMLNSELEILQQKIDDVIHKCEEANKNSDELKRITKDKDECVRAIHEELQKVDESRQKLMLQLNNQKDIKRKAESKLKDSEMSYKEVCRNVEKSMELYKQQEEQTEEIVKHACNMCPQRIRTKRPIDVIRSDIKDCEVYQNMVEEENGVTEDLLELLDEKKKIYLANLEQMNNIENGLKALAVSLQNRKKLYKYVRRVMALKVLYTFKPLLTDRHFKGDLIFDHVAKTLDVQVVPTQDNGMRATKSLSGGERSYSTVAFILALWQCVEPPFYFMDEFDVFMDRVNRTYVMKILLCQAKENKKHQYVFLTPQDISQITASEDLTIHRLDDPERKALQ